MTARQPVFGFCSVSSGVWGAERSMMTLARELRASGVQPVLLCTSDEVAQAWTNEVGTTATVVPLDGHRAGQRVHVNARMWKAVARRSDLDAVVIFSYVLAAGAAYYRARRRRGKRAVAVLDLHDNLGGARGRLLLRLAARSFDAAVSVSKHTDAQLEGIRIRRSVLYRPVATPPKVETRGAEGICRVGVIGRLDPQKKIDLAVDAIAGLGDGFRLVLRGGAADGGSAEFSADLLARASRALGTRLQFDGPVDWSSVLGGLDVLVVCNEDEPMGRTVAEAQLAGLLVVVPDRGGSSELVEDGVTGITYKAADATALADALRQVADRGPQHDAMIENARVVAANRHAAASYAVQYIEAVGRPTASERDADRS